jgi:DNA-binding NarL/FixJ family response regulator
VKPASTLSFMISTQNVVLLEDHPLYRNGLIAYIKKAFPHLEITYAGDDFIAARDAISKHHTSLAIVDLHLGDSRTPSELVSLFTTKKIPVLVISALNNFESVKSAFSMGALGFVSKDSSIEEVGRAIKNVLGGKEWVSQTLSNVLNYKSSAIDQLSAQEKKAVILYASGLKLEVVARRMDLAPSTAKQYIDRAKAKFKLAGVMVRTKTEMYKVLRDEGLIS